MKGRLSGHHRKRETVQGRGKRFLALAVTAAMLGITATPAFAETKPMKDETVYVVTEADGSQSEVTVSDHLVNDARADELKDRTNLKDIVNVKGEETFRKGKGDSIIWKAEGNDIFYDGTTEEKVPVQLGISYFLDGEEVEGSDMEGASGDVKIVINYRNTAQSEDGTTIPFVVLTAFIAEDDSFTNVKIDHGKVIDDGDKQIVAALAVPGLDEALNLDSDIVDLDLDDTVTITGHAKNFNVQDMMTVVTNTIFEELDTDDFGDLDYDDQIKELDKGAKALSDGAGELYDGMNQLNSSMPQMQEGVEALDSGALKLRGSLISQMKKIRDNTGKMKAGTDTILSGLKTMKTGLDKGNGTKKNPGAINALDQVAVGLKKSVGQTKKAAKDLGDAGTKMTAGAEELATGAEKLSTGADNAKAGSDQLAAGAKNAKDGADQLAAGVKTVSDGATQLAQGAADTRKGAEDLAKAPAGLEPYLAPVIDQEGNPNAAIYTELKSKGVSDETINKLFTAAGAGRTAQQVLKDAANGMNNAADGLQLGADGMTSASQGLQAGADGLKGASDGLQAGADGLAAASDGMNEASGGMTTASETLSDTGEQLTDASATMKTSAKKLGTAADAVSKVESGLKKMSNSLGEYDQTRAKQGKSQTTLIGGMTVINAGLGTMQSEVAKSIKKKGKLRKALNKLVGGTGDLKDGANQMADGTQKLNDGSKQLAKGASMLYKDGIKKIVDLDNDDLKGNIDDLEDLMDAGKSYKSFTRLPKGMDGSVKFIYRTSVY